MVRPTKTQEPTGAGEESRCPDRRKRLTTPLARNHNAICRLGRRLGATSHGGAARSTARLKSETGEEGKLTMRILKATATGRPFGGRSLLGLLSSAAMMLVFHGTANAADAPPIPNDALPITKAPPPVAAPVPGHYKIGEIDLSVSGIATLGTAIRTTGRDAILVPPQNGHVIGIPGQAVGGANADDGNINWDSGKPVSTVAKTFVTFDANYREKVGVFSAA